MDNVLIVGRNADKLEEIKIYLEQLAQFKVVTLSDAGQLQNTLVEVPISVVVLDLDISDMDTLGLLIHMNRRHPTIPLIVACSCAIPVFSNLDNYETILRYIEKPFDYSRLAVSIFEALTIRDEGFSYWGITVRSILPLIEITGKSGCLKIHPSGNSPGYIYFGSGKLLDAEYGELTGEAAAIALMDLSRVEISLSNLPENRTASRFQNGVMDLIGAQWSTSDDTCEDGKTSVKEGAADKPSDDIEALKTAVDETADIALEPSVTDVSKKAKYSLDHVCQELLDKIDDARGVAIIDLNDGDILAFVQKALCLAQGHVATVATTMDLYRGDALKKLLCLEQTDPSYNAITQIQMTTEATHHFMSVIPGNTDKLLVLTTGKQVNLGFGWMSMRQALNMVAPICPQLGAR